jgi:hypothetical protein
MENLRACHSRIDESLKCTRNVRGECGVFVVVVHGCGLAPVATIAARAHGGDCLLEGGEGMCSSSVDGAGRYVVFRCPPLPV